jgi:anti-sigma regulatory factor (Ser/Thr protein kinase)
VATVELRFTALPEHVRTARLVAVSLARRAGVEDATLDEVRLAVGEAATRAVGRHRSSCPAEPVLVRLTDGQGRFVAEVVDVAPGPSDASGQDSVASEPDLAGHAQAEPLGVDALDEPLPDGIDLAVIGSLVDDVTVTTDGEGSVVRMAWPAPPDGVAGPASGQAAFGTSAPSA